MQRYSIEEAQGHLPELIDAALHGEDILIVQDDEHVIRLAPAQPLRRARKAGSAQGMVIISDDFDVSLEDFGEYMA
jgi:antitoxin (DNA-binding transcriptional repressor) of toxin-antitoxin stability system